MWAINGKVFSPSRIDARPKLGSTEIWELTTDVHHPVHIHLVHFKVLSRNGGEPPPTDAGWKDTIDLRPFEVARVICPLRWLQRQVRLPLPQLRARGHDDDGQLRGGLKAAAENRKEAGHEYGGWIEAPSRR